MERRAKIDQLDDFKMSPLHHAAKGGHTDTAKILLENKADKNLKNNDNRTPLEEAKFHENRGVANFIENWDDPES